MKLIQKYRNMSNVSLCKFIFGTLIKLIIITTKKKTTTKVITMSVGVLNVSSIKSI